MEPGPGENNNSHGQHVRDGNSNTDGGTNSYLDFIISSGRASAVRELNNDQDIITSPRKSISSPREVGKGQQEMESTRNQTDINIGPYTENDNFTEDQKRAMMELMAQTQEDADLLDEEPPEYDVKDRVDQLNKDLAKDTTPVDTDRKHKVGFKQKIVDLMASPPPDYSDDEPQSSSNKQDTTSAIIQKKNGSIADSTDVPNMKETNKRQFVVERDGQFSVVSATDLTSTEKCILMNDNESEHNTERQIGYQTTQYKSDSYSDGQIATSTNTYANVTPQPPSRPRPNSVVPDSRRMLYPAQSPRPRSTGQLTNYGIYRDKFTYISPYAMTSEQKAAAKEQARRTEKDRKEKEKIIKLEEEKRRRESESAFQAWLNLKQEQEKQRQKNDNKMEKSEQERKEENDEAYKSWLKEKKSQVKQERLLKRQQQREWSEGFYLRSHEECEKAFKEWLKRKNLEVKKQQMMERQRNRLIRIQVKQSRKTLAFIKALRESQAFRYMDYYGYRF